MEAAIKHAFRLTTEQLNRRNIAIHEFVLSSDKNRQREQLDDICGLIELHPLTLEDCMKGDQRAKFEVFPEYFFLVLHYFGSKDQEISELHVVVRNDLFLILAHKNAPGNIKWSEFFRLSYTQTLAELIHRVFDSCIDSALECSTGIEDKIAKAEMLILDDKFTPRDILVFKQQTLQFQRTINGVFPVLKQLMSECELPAQSEPMFRDVLDHQERLKFEIEFLHTDLNALFELHYSSAGHSANEQIKRLNMVATLVVPLAFWTGFFGMNFTVLPFDKSWFFGLAMLLMLGSVGFTYFFFVGRKKSSGK